MKFEIIDLKRKRLRGLHLYPQLVLIKFEDGRTAWFDTYPLGNWLFWYVLFRHIRDFLGQYERASNRKRLFTTEFEITDNCSYQKYENLLVEKPTVEEPQKP
jgi:hypothetical protein